MVLYACRYFKGNLMGKGKIVLVYIWVVAATLPRESDFINFHVPFSFLKYVSGLSFRQLYITLIHVLLCNKYLYFVL